MKVRELLGDESKWNKYVFAKDSTGHGARPLDANACSWCLSGAIIYCYGKDDSALMAVNSAIFHKIGQSTAVWNDARSTTFKDIRSLVEELDI